MIKDNDLDTASSEISDFGHRRSAAINRNQKLRSIGLAAAFNPFAAETITFLHSGRQKGRGRRAIGREHFVQKRERGHAIDIIVAVKHNPLVLVDRTQDALHRSGHVRE
jgi:hypothetical protein